MIRCVVCDFHCCAVEKRRNLELKYNLVASLGLPVVGLTIDSLKGFLAVAVA